MKDIPLQSDVAAKLAAFAARHNESLEAAVEHALREYFNREEEEAVRWEETLAADAAIARGEAVDGEKVLAWLKSWGTGSELPPP